MLITRYTKEPSITHKNFDDFNSYKFGFLIYIYIYIKFHEAYNTKST